MIHSTNVVLAILAAAAVSLFGARSNAEILVHSTGEGLTQGDPDPNWLVTLPDGTNFGNAISATDPHDLWIMPTAPNTWIGVVARGDAPLGLYKFSTTFTVPLEIDPLTVQVTGNWWADGSEEINAIYLNGVKVSDFNGGAWYNPSRPSSLFSIESGFQTGLNTLEFTVANYSGPGGTLIQFPGVVPEPSSLVLFSLGTLGVCWLAARTAKRLPIATSRRFDNGD
jgi:PEP-CTERM motif